MTDETLPTYRLDDSVAVITLDDGKANVFSRASLTHLEALVDQAEADGARALVLVGRPGRFSAGFNLDEMTATVEGMRALVVQGARFWLRIYGLGMPTVAACTGHALAGGAITLLSCDRRVGADVPAKIGLNEVAIGLTLPKFAVELARDRLTKASFTAATMGAQIFDAAGAQQAGFLDVVVPEADLVSTAMDEARRLGQIRTGAYAATKLNARAELIERVLADVVADLDSIDAPSV
ncbi:crotonase/enoyl-CoA hydratase family protein [Aquihabitans sp. McL0605]|uniref:crotonase/enoyl-CoA hydratase family protein n=1 Tax=Aquihabitans sp. McL0605 TaxID=3415671 RepID=UPI003CF03AF7